MLNLRLTLVLAGLLLLGFGCGEDPPAMTQCGSDAECDDGNACNGAEACVLGMCGSSENIEDGSTCSIEGMTGTFVCISGYCVAGFCGDGVVDATGDIPETCDDGNDVSGDGCDPDCMYSCEDSSECDDTEVCNGEEACDEMTHTCQPGMPLPDMTDCGMDRVCNSGSCIPAGCQNGVLDPGEQCDDGNDVSGDGCEPDCSYTCSDDTDCTDGNACNGAEVCDLGTHTCSEGAALDCTAMLEPDACHTADCDPETGCALVVIDGDGDGVASESLGDCGTDCDDTDATVYKFAPELCDGQDNDCDMAIDEEAPAWYVDCDGYGYAPTGAASMSSCTMPVVSPSGCGLGAAARWTSRAPGRGTTDCDDGNDLVNPVGTWNWRSIDGAGSRASHDYNCDSVNEKRWTLTGVSARATCSGVGISCSGATGWIGTTVPNCGSADAFTQCASSGRICERQTLSAFQQCR